MKDKQPRWEEHLNDLSENREKLKDHLLLCKNCNTRPLMTTRPESYIPLSNPMAKPVVKWSVSRIYCPHCGIYTEHNNKDVVTLWWMFGDIHFIKEHMIHLEAKDYVFLDIDKYMEIYNRIMGM